MLREFESTGFIRVLVYAAIGAGVLIFLLLSQVPATLSANLLEAIR